MDGGFSDVIREERRPSPEKEKDSPSLKSLSSSIISILHLSIPQFLLNRRQILDKIWDSDGKYVDNNTVSVNISRLRTKIEDDASSPVRIKTVHGIGYIWKE